MLLIARRLISKVKEEGGTLLALPINNLAWLLSGRLLCSLQMA